MRKTIVIPTYNERDNVGRLIEELLALPVPELSVLVVDDSSPDGTGELVRTLAARSPRVRLLSRPLKDGLGRAYSAAFAALLETQNPEPGTPDIVVQMDADFSHNPQDVPRLLRALKDADVAVGSRYVPGGGTVNWGIGRRLLSHGANAYARLLTRAPLRDLTSGFNAWRAPALAAAAPHTIRAEGYGYLVELKVRAARRGAKIAEVPITFVERRLGQSKLSKRVIWEAASVVLRLGLERRKSA